MESSGKFNGDHTIKVSVTNVKAELINDVKIKAEENSSSKDLFCCVCHTEFSSVLDLIRHACKEHPALSILKCPVQNCQMKFHDYNSRIRHLKSAHSEERPYLCEVCGDAFKQTSALKNHTYCIHAESKDKIKFQCKVCGRVFHKKHGLKAHESLHTGVRKYACDVKDCEKTFRLQDTYRRHMQLHNNDLKYKCELCGKAYNRVDLLIAHEDKHAGVKPHKCELCAKSFSTKGNLSTHMKIHEGIRFDCKVCGRTFGFKSNLNKHVKDFHSDLHVDTGKVGNTKTTMISKTKYTQCGEKWRKAKKKDLVNEAVDIRLVCKESANDLNDIADTTNCDEVDVGKSYNVKTDSVAKMKIEISEGESNTENDQLVSLLPKRTITYVLVGMNSSAELQSVFPCPTKAQPSDGVETVYNNERTKQHAPATQPIDEDGRVSNNERTKCFTTCANGLVEVRFPGYDNVISSYSQKTTTPHSFKTDGTEVGAMKQESVVESSKELLEQDKAQLNDAENILTEEQIEKIVDMDQEIDV
ncbi:zinc finger protein 117-like [Mya arenaria]|uniref:zinc finger protein 117-like n=1 Tax=Mya arenaria TaxID=6604 RepID=UPI0022E6CF35|nr:zinc finger protein 117-like [Mya arenaria]